MMLPVPSYICRILENGPDAECKGLRFCNGNWIRRYKSRAGKMKQYIFASYPETSIEQARDYVNSVRGTDSPAIAQLGEPTIGLLIERYLNEYIEAQRTVPAAATVRSALLRNLRPIMTKRLKDLDAAILHEIILTTKKRAPTMAQLMRSELKQAWSYGLSTGITRIPCPITSLTGGRFTRRARDRILNDTELTQLISSIGQFTDTLSDVINICLYTGLRSGEVVATHSEELETDNNGVLWLTIPQTRMKNVLAHRVPLLSKAEEIIKNRADRYACGYLFPRKNDQAGPIRQATLAREVYRHVLGAWHLHDLRRTTRTNLQRIGCPFEISETILAHKLPGVSSVYARFQYNDEKIKWLSELAGFYDRISGFSGEV